MQDTLARFVTVLRGAGVRISTAESLDACRAAALVGVGDRAVLRDTLAVTLAKSVEEKAVLARCFDDFFRPPDTPAAPSPTGGQPPTDDAATPSPLPPTPLAPDAGSGGMAGGTASGGGRGLSPLASAWLTGDQSGLEQRLAAARDTARLGEMRLMTQRGLFARRLLLAAGLEALEDDLARLAASPDDASRRLAERLEAGREALRAHARQVVADHWELQGQGERQTLREEMLMDRPLTELHDLDAALPLVRKLAKRLVSRQRRRLRREHRGLPDLRRTLTGALQTDGVIMRPHWRTRRIDRPRLRVLCDVSGSVSRVSTFLLTFVFALVDALDDVRAYAFSSSLGEVTDWFERQSPADAVGLTLARYGRGSTDHGRAFGDFLQIAGNALDRRTTVIILGDARNNDADPNLAALAHLRRRCRQVIWLNPEPRARWGSGDSEMPRFLAHVTHAAECRNLRQLEQFAATLLRSPSHPGRLP